MIVILSNLICIASKHELVSFPDCRTFLCGSLGMRLLYCVVFYSRGCLLFLCKEVYFGNGNNFCRTSYLCLSDIAPDRALHFEGLNGARLIAINHPDTPAVQVPKELGLSGLYPTGKGSLFCVNLAEIRFVKLFYGEPHSKTDLISVLTKLT